ncbi:sigma-70 family RNA polymerase sigma factor [Streptomyces cinnabarinus]|uniref:Sigma-70 family RNA polymerase sigma factor n=1 Tax=Streptomyces cinnabarinus TaxID=67287 RepID=A0ABY7KCD9_9ACTN|nr:sigma-70 family RNA polymerase sigma factor [Streptomyces cinnabarinus]WAZ21400.1 sigma-70 family RNA polymerase sigma factor [Streptomyces cinnabarinus]
MGEIADEWSVFEAVYRDAYHPVVRYLVRRLAPDLVDDAASEVFVIAWERWPTKRGDALPWLYGIARRVAANARRSQGRVDRLAGRLRGEEDSAGGEPGADVEVLERLGAARVLARLSESDREVLMLVSWDGLDANEAAQALGCSKAAFAVRLHRARRRLERELAKDGPAVVDQRPVPAERNAT